MVIMGLRRGKLGRGEKKGYICRMYEIDGVSRSGDWDDVHDVVVLLHPMRFLHVY